MAEGVRRALVEAREIDDPVRIRLDGARRELSQCEVIDEFLP